MNYAFHPQAREEFHQSVLWYEDQRPGLGMEFIGEVQAAIGRIVASPERWPRVHGNNRRHLTHRFPFGILYRIRRDSIEILAIMHLSREPGYWHRRLKD